MDPHTDIGSKELKLPIASLLLFMEGRFANFVRTHMGIIQVTLMLPTMYSNMFQTLNLCIKSEHKYQNFALPRDLTNIINGKMSCAITLLFSYCEDANF